MGSASRTPAAGTIPAGRRTIAAAVICDRGRSAQLVDPPPVAAAFEGRAEKDCQAIRRDLGPERARTQYQYIGVVVLPRQTGGRDIVAQCRPQMAVAVGSDADPDPRAADQDATLGPAVAKSGRKGCC